MIDAFFTTIYDAYVAGINVWISVRPDDSPYDEKYWTSNSLPYCNDPSKAYLWVGAWMTLEEFLIWKQASDKWIVKILPSAQFIFNDCHYYIPTETYDMYWIKHSMCHF